MLARTNGECGRCGMNATTPGEARARLLEEMVQAIERRVERLSEETLYRDPADGVWSVMKALAHVAEAMPYWARQARNVAGRERNNEPFGRTHEDPDRIAAVEAHARDRMEDVLPRLRAGLAETAETLRSLPSSVWQQTGRHERRGEMTIEQIVDQFIVSHAEEHLNQIEATIARAAAE
jgi:uncharacterized damage-inducible protein DinB